MKIIDLDAWERKGHYQFFLGMDCPQFVIGADMDITAFKRSIKSAGLSFSLAMTYAVSVIMNEIEAFRYRIRDEQVVLHEKIHPSFTYISPGSQYFKMVSVEAEGSIQDFVRLTEVKAKSQKDDFPLDGVQYRDDLIYVSSIPWISFTHLTHTISNKKDAVPRVSWGKYYERDGKVLLPFNMQVHHSFVDGAHVGEYMQKLQAFFDAY